jgi:hypothetical protein
VAPIPFTTTTTASLGATGGFIGDPADDSVDDLVDLPHRFAAEPRLAVAADAELHLVVADLESRHPAAGTVNEVEATPIVRVFASRPRTAAAISTALWPAAAVASQYNQMSNRPATPRRNLGRSASPASSVATASSTSMPSSLAISAAISKFMTSPE